MDGAAAGATVAEVGAGSGAAGAGCGSWAAVGGAGEDEGASFHALDVADHVIQRRVVCEDKVLVNGQTEFVPDVRHDFRLLDRVNAQLSSRSWSSSMKSAG